VLKTVPGRDGWFAGRFRAGPPGDYELEVRVKETGAARRVRFRVRGADDDLALPAPE
jgi:hypothetical protein